MRRRTLLSLLVGAGVAGVVGCFGDGSAPAEAGDVAETTSNTAGPAFATALSGSGSGDLPLVVNTVDTQGSSAGEVRIPAEGASTVLDLFATWCAPCVAQMGSLRTLHEEFGDGMTFVSVTSERLGGGLTMDDIRDWWAEHDGDWTVGHDPDSSLMCAVHANGLPYLVVFDADGEATWTHRGLAGEESLRAAVEDVI